jgi:hypothetical protein
MVIRFDDWVFDVDITSTMTYSAQEAAEHCTCGYCRNFYAAVDKVYPNLRRFFAEFGIDIEAPDELCPYEPSLMDGYYAVCGRVIQRGTKPFIIDGLTITVEVATEQYINTCCPAPYFLLHTGIMELPWVLDESSEDVISTANAPDFLGKILNRITGLQPDTDIEQ